ncbi:hypothetical protein ABIB50_001423 [Mucilaginibacter sp. UYCu711]
MAELYSIANPIEHLYSKLANKIIREMVILEMLIA